LIERAGEVASKGETTWAVWPGTVVEDSNQLCAEVKPGESRLKSRIKEHFGQLSPPCQTALLSNLTITKSCKTDAQQKCPDSQPGGGRIQACTKDHFTELSERCKVALLLAKLQQQ
jgi:hypothetical protein